MKSYIFFVGILVQSLAQSRPQLEPFGFFGFPIFSSRCSWSLNEQNFRWKFTVVLSLPPIWVLLLPIYVSLFAARVFRHVWPFVWPNVFRSLCDLFLGKSSLNSHVSFWCIFVEQFESCHTNPKSWKWLVSITIPTIIDGSLMKYENARFPLSLGFNVIRRYRKTVHLWNKRPLSRSNMISICVNSHNAPEILSNFDVWIWISGFFFSVWRIVLRFPRGSRSPRCRQR